MRGNKTDTACKFSEQIEIEHTLAWLYCHNARVKERESVAIDCTLREDKEIVMIAVSHPSPISTMDKAHSRWA